MKLTYKNGKYKRPLINVLLNLFNNSAKVNTKNIFYYDITIDKDAWYESSGGYNELAGFVIDEDNEVKICWKPAMLDNIEVYEIFLKRVVAGKQRYFSISKIFKGEELTLEMFCADKSYHKGHEKFKYDWAVNINIEVYALNGERRFHTHRAVLFNGDMPDEVTEVYPTVNDKNAKNHTLDYYSDEG